MAWYWWVVIAIGVFEATWWLESRAAKVIRLLREIIGALQAILASISEIEAGIIHERQMKRKAEEGRREQASPPS